MAERSCKVLMVSSEAVPFAKTGGLADVAGALPRELANLGHQVRLVIPRYGTIGDRYGFREWKRIEVPGPAGPVPAVIERSVMPGCDVPVLAIRHDHYFNRAGLYGEAGSDYPDNLDRFAFFCQAVMELVPLLSRGEGEGGEADGGGWTPDLLHAHDWQTALVPVYRRTLYAGQPALAKLRSLFTVHNMGYQGLFPASAYPKTGLGWEWFTPQWLEFYGQLNLLKGGLVSADWLTTVSPTYSREIQTAELGFGLEGVVLERRDRVVGIVNGIDVDQWNPATDPHLPARYSPRDLSGKRTCKEALQREMSLPVRDVPLVGIVSRLSWQKGLDLLAEALPALMNRDLQLVLLGTGEPALEAQFRALRDRFPKQLGLRIGFDEGLAHRIEAGADLFLMPSRYEPCGLTQLASLRYGTVPVVRRTGGLADTVVPYGAGTGSEGPATGFQFQDATPDSLREAVELALLVYADRDRWLKLIRAGMETDVSWAKSARAYAGLYRRMLEGKPRDG
ncbi:MAG: glycogen synthase GlgA [Nitrospirota bacterium]